MLTLCLPVFQGRPGSDGARGMPGQTGPKVGSPQGSQPPPPLPLCW